MSIRITADSSSNLRELEGADFCSVPLIVRVGDRSFPDDESFRLEEMEEALKAHHGKTGSACPGPHDWIEGFGGRKEVVCLAMTGSLSGAYQSAVTAKKIYEEENPGAEVHVINTFTTGPELALILEKVRDLVNAGLSAVEVARRTEEYRKRTHLVYVLKSLKNLADNGRVSPIIAKGISLLGIRLVCTASDDGRVVLLGKCRGAGKALKDAVKSMKELGFSGGRVIIAHYRNLEAAEEIRDLLKKTFGSFNGFIHEETALCSYYAEEGSVMLGFEGE